MKNREKQKCRVDHQVRLRCQCYAKNISPPHSETSLMPKNDCVFTVFSMHGGAYLRNTACRNDGKRCGGTVVSDDAMRRAISVKINRLIGV